jgi:hypothetical protein
MASEPEVWLVMCEDPEGYTSREPWPVGHEFGEEDAQMAADERNAHIEDCDSCGKPHERYFITQSRRATAVAEEND